MSLRVAASYGVVQTVVSLLCSYASVKLTAVWVGPAGFGLIGIMTYLVSLTQNVLAHGLQNGFVRRASDSAMAPSYRATLVSTVFRTMLFLGLPAACAVLLASPWLAATVLHDPAMSTAVMLFGLSYVFGLLSFLALGSAVSAKDMGAVTAMGIGNAVTSTLLFALLCPWLGAKGGVAAVAVMPLAGFLVSWSIARRKGWWTPRPWAHGFAGGEALAVAALVPAAAVNGIAMPLIQLLVRDYVSAQSGADAVGLLQGVVRLSDVYLAMVITLLGSYFLPRFAGTVDPTLLRHELTRAFTFIVPLVAVVSLLIYLLRDLIIRLVFTEEFLPMRELFAWQMIGNTLRMGGWVFGYLLLAKAHPFGLAMFEIGIALLWWWLSLVLISADGVVGATQAYAATYAAYLAVGASVGYWMLRRMHAGKAQD